MKAEFTALIKRDGDWWLGWVEQIPGANAQEKTKEELIISLREAARDILEIHSEEATPLARDGLRHANEAHLLIEFKFSEGLNLTALQQLNAYDYFYRIGKGYSEHEVACFLIASSTPQGEWYRNFGFVKTDWPGVYQGGGPYIQRMCVILLNELANTSHNAPLKCFASRKKEREAAFGLVQHSGFERLSMAIDRLITGLRKLFYVKYTT